jgi:peptidoglycan/LPS O-acetylase OafA/YrhL
MAKASTLRLQSIDMLRGIAALAVVFLHVPCRSSTWGESPDLKYWLFLPFEFGWLGVPLFIVLSGFCIHANTLRDADGPSGNQLGVNWRRFWMRRFVRLYPPYVAAVALSVVVIGVLYLAVQDQHFITKDYFDGQGLKGSHAATDIALHLLMVHNLFAGFGMSLGNGPLWSLGMEEQLYALYFVYLLLRRQLPRWTVMLAIFGISAIAWPLWNAHGPSAVPLGGVALGDWAIWPFTYWFAWCLGTLAAEAYHGRLHLPWWCRSAPVGLLALLGLMTFHTYVWQPLTGAPSVGMAATAWLGWEGSAASVLTFTLNRAAGLLAPVSFFILTNAAVAHELRQGAAPRGWRPALAWVGLFSYSLYLTHVPIIHLLGHFLRFREPASILMIAGRYAFCVPVCVGFGWLFFHLVERHFLVKKPRHQPSGLPSTAAPAVQRQAA